MLSSPLPLLTIVLSVTMKLSINLSHMSGIKFFFLPGLFHLTCFQGSTTLYRNIPSYVQTTFCLSIHLLMAIFHLLAILNNAATTIGIQISVQVPTFCNMLFLLYEKFLWWKEILLLYILAKEHSLQVAPQKPQFWGGCSGHGAVQTGLAQGPSGQSLFWDMPAFYFLNIFWRRSRCLRWWVASELDQLASSGK